MTATADGRGATSQRRLDAISVAAHISEEHRELLPALRSPTLDQLNEAHDATHRRWGGKPHRVDGVEYTEDY
jgi:hypothetical protein